MSISLSLTAAWLLLFIAGLLEIVWSVVCICLIVVGILGLKLFSGDSAG